MDSAREGWVVSDADAVGMPASPGSVLNDGLLLRAVDFKRHLNQIPQPALVVFIHRHKSERLLRSRNRCQHFGRAQQSAGVSQTHESDPSPSIQWTRQAQQSTSLGNDLHRSAHAPPALRAQNSRSRTSKLHSRRPPVGFVLLSATHAQPLCSSKNGTRDITKDTLQKVLWEVPNESIF